MKAFDAVRFILLVLRRGKLRHSGHDFHEERRRLLTGARGVEVPPGKTTRVTRLLMKNAILRTLIAGAAFAKTSMTPQGGHLSSGEGITYVRIPKAASTALCKMILQSRLPSADIDTLTPEQINALADIHLERSVPQGGNQLQLFSVVRNPFARIVSVYREFFEQAQGHFVYEDYLMGIFRRDFSFRQFVHTLRIIPDVLKDQHLKPQVRLLRFYEKKKLAVTILRLEDKPALDNYIGARGLKLEDVHRSTTPYDYRTYYDRETLESIKEVYECDISRFAYGHFYDEIKSVIEQRAVHI